MAAGGETCDSWAGVASIFYVTIVGSKQGKIHGDVTLKGKEGKIGGLDFSYEAEVLASAGGQAGGQLHRGPVQLTKAWDSTTPKLLQAFVENETLTSVLFEFWRPTASGAEALYQTIELDDAVIARIHWHLRKEDSARAAGGRGGTPDHGANELEDIAFSFKTMHVQNVQKQTAAADSWVLSRV
jgi:type VI secretion system secreted protein Hcp